MDVSYREMYEGQLRENETLQNKVWNLKDKIRELEDEIDILRNGHDPSDDEYDFRLDIISGLKGR